MNEENPYKEFVEAKRKATAVNRLRGSGVYRRRPVEVQAFRFGHDEVPLWCLDLVAAGSILPGLDFCLIVASGTRCPVGHWLVFCNGYLWVVEPAMFDLLYEEVSDARPYPR